MWPFVNEDLEIRPYCVPFIGPAVKGIGVQVQDSGADPELFETGERITKEELHSDERS